MANGTVRPASPCSTTATRAIVELKKTDNMKMKWICIASGVLLALGLLQWSYGYYTLLRWLIFGSAVLVAVRFYNSKLTGWTLIFGVISFLFNPIIPVYLTRQIWAPIDLVGACLFFVAAYSLKGKNK